MSTTLRRILIATLVALAVIGGSAIALAQGTDTPAPADEPAVEQEVQFVGDPPGNNQTGEWEGEYEYEG